MPTIQSRLSPIDNDSNAFCCTAYKTVNNTLCTNIHNGSSRPAFSISLLLLNPLSSSNPTAPSQRPLQPRTSSSSSPSCSTRPSPLFIGLATGLPLALTCLLLTTICHRQRRQLMRLRRRTATLSAQHDAQRTYVVLPDRRVVPGRGIVRASSQLILEGGAGWDGVEREGRRAGAEGKAGVVELDGRELRRGEWPLPPLPLVVARAGEKEDGGWV
ncbi:MAG: hypothetical protein M1821_000537 [Bathelium mastoideum]|nr:MAG: hypothetical protein M1821_000537 [Bathelium mastoideum]